MNTSKRRGRPPKNKTTIQATPKKRGRPPKNTVTINAVPKKRGRPPNVSFQEWENDYLHDVIAKLERELEIAQTKIKNFEHQQTGYKALISYFEYQLGLKASQDDNRTSV